MRVMLDKTLKLLRGDLLNQGRFTSKSFFFIFRDPSYSVRLDRLNRVPWSRGEQEDRHGWGCRRGVERRRPQGDPGIRERKPPAQRTTRVASDSQAARATVHRTGEQYPVKMKRFTQLSSSGGINDLRPNPPSEPPNSLPMGRNSSGGTHQSCEWEFH